VSQIASPTQTRSAAVAGALWMLAAGVTYALLNVAVQWATMVAGVASPAVAFWQYALAFVFALPLVWREGRSALRTRQWPLHIARVVLAAAGVQVWVYALSIVPLWQAIALSMTSPFFVIAGAALFLREPVTLARIGFTLMGFVGALIIIAPWSETFTLYALLPVVSAALWAGTSLITKRLTREESSASIAVYLLLLLTPINAVLWIGSGFAMPDGSAWAILFAAGVLTAASQYFLTRAYSVADATYLQPFDDLKLPLNLLASWAVFATAPNPTFWPGAVLIVAASLLIMRQEAAKR
jgi:drug/metabolite transporter (DMT)-like permease